MLSFGVILRLVISTGVVVGALLAVRWWSTRAAVRGRGAIRVLARTGVGRSAAVAVIEVGPQRFLVGAGEHSVNLLAVLDPDVDLEGAVTRPVASIGGDPADVRIGQQPEPVTTGPVTRSFVDVDGPTFLKDLREGPRIGPLAHLRRMTTRVPREVRIHGLDD